ncbi:MAG: bifunctional folylpolyglutamate synthase/dihydrofolate synthase [Acidobacteria bacterium]|nr:bifunctional folylpolyglutamate synthase/dihydrofolate synthase [Acidobacteriota bacterium]
MTESDPLLAWLFSLKGPSLKWDLETARSLARWLGDPQERFRSVHVAGTNGKGSVAAMVQAVAGAAGLRAGLYTSPHLVRPEERIRPGEDEIGPSEFRALIARLRPRAEAALAAGALTRFPSFFEMLTAAAFTAFAEHGIQLAAIEAGLGGRLDATNVITPEIAVITTIGMDHVKTLGPRLVDIAGEKAGIVKPGVPVLAGWLPRGPLAVVAAAARERGAPLHAAARELRVRATTGERFTVITPRRPYRELRVALAGRHQQRNAALAIRALELVAERTGLEFPPEAVARGLASVRWPGRLEEIALHPRFLLDGAHNGEGARALARHLSESGRRVRPCVFGLTEGRNARALLLPLRRHVGPVIVTRPGIDKACAPAAVAAALGALAPDVEIVEEPAAALARAAALAGPAGEVLVTGSLYLVGDARRILLRLDGSGHPPRESNLPPARGGAP